VRFIQSNIERSAVVLAAGGISHPGDTEISFRHQRHSMTGEHYFRHALTWHGALLWSFGVGRVCTALLGTPRSAKPVELLLIARKPQS
jgi:hypothetical protein